MSDNHSKNHNGEKFIPSGKIRQMFGGISDMTLYRWRKDQGFPKPLSIGGRNYFDVQEVAEWAKRRKTGA